ncbi:hypothetical protein X975_09041, partial [Stegodyphus mimosarum]
MEGEATEAIEIEHHELRPFAADVCPEPTQYPVEGHSHGSFVSSISSISCMLTYAKTARFTAYALLFITCIPFIIGAAFTSIFIEDKNYNAVTPAFLSACLSLGTISLLCLQLLAKLEKYHDTGTLEGLKVFGMILSIFSGISVGVYTILAFLNKQAFNLHGTNYFSSAVFSGLSLVCGLELYLTAQWYQDALQVQQAAQ